MTPTHPEIIGVEMGLNDKFLSAKRQITPSLLGSKYAVTMSYVGLFLNIKLPPIIEVKTPSNTTPLL